MDKYRWNILGLSELRWKGFGEITVGNNHKLFYSGKNDKHEYGVGFLVNKEIVNTVISCTPVSSRIILLRVKATPFNITIVQIYAPTSAHDEQETDQFYSKVQEQLDKAPKQDIKLVLGDFNAKVGKDSINSCSRYMGESCNDSTNENGEKLLEFAAYNDMILANTLGKHKKSRCTTWHSPDGQTANQIDYILIDRRFKSSVCTARTRTFPKADVGSDHDLVMMTFKIHLKQIKKQAPSRIKFNLEKLNDPEVAEMFKAQVGGKFAPLLALTEDPSNIENIVETFNNTIIEAASETLGKARNKKQPWMTDEILAICDERRRLKPYRKTQEKKVEYRAINRQVKQVIKSAKEAWIEDQCNTINDCLVKNNSKQAYDLVKKLTGEDKGRAIMIQDSGGKDLVEEQEIIGRWTEYCEELYTHQDRGDPSVLTCPEQLEEEPLPILREEVVEAIKTLKPGKAPGVDNITSELLIAGGDAVVDVLHSVCNHTWKTGEWPSKWTRSLIITIPKKGNSKKCENYRTISLISHASKVMLRIILNRLQPQAEHIISEEQAGFRAGRSTVEQIFNLNILCQKYKQHNQDLYHIFIDYKKAFDRVWHAALFATMKKYNISPNLIRVIASLYESATSAVLFNGKVGRWFCTTIGVRQGCLLSPTLFNLFLEMIMTEALELHEGSVSVGGRSITNLRFADDIDGLAGSEQELFNLTNAINSASTRYGMEINGEKTKIMTNNPAGFKEEMILNNETVEVVNKFKYLGSIISDKGSKPEIVARLGQATKAICKLQRIWKSRTISLTHKLKLINSLVHSVFLYGCETWTLTADLEKRITSFEMKCFRRILNITFRDHITNQAVRDRLAPILGNRDDLLTSVKKRKLKWYGHVSRGHGMATTILQGTVPGGRKPGRQKLRWEDNVKEWTGLTLPETHVLTKDREAWQKLVREINGAPTTNNG